MHRSLPKAIYIDFKQVFYRVSWTGHQPEAGDPSTASHDPYVGVLMSFLKIGTAQEDTDNMKTLLLWLSSQ